MLLGYSYYNKGSVNATVVGAQTDYQMMLTVGESSGSPSCDVHCEGQCTDFPNDIRFTGADRTTKHDYWVESLTGTTPNRVAIIWIEVATIPATAAVDFYMFYEKSGDSGESDGSNTFVLFDDFLGSSLDTNKWLSVGSVSVAASKVTIQSGNSRIQSKSNYGVGHAIRGYGKLDDRNAWGQSTIGWNSEFLHFYAIAIYSYRKSAGATPLTGYTKKPGGVSLIALNEYESSSYRVFDLMRANASLCRFRADGGVIKDITTNIPTDSYPIILHSRMTTDITEFDWVLQRKYAFPEPTWGTWGGAVSAKKTRSYAFIIG